MRKAGEVDMKPNGPLEGNRKICPICGREFWAMAVWRYRTEKTKTKKRKYLCSWGCLQKAAAMNQEGKAHE